MRALDLLDILLLCWIVVAVAVAFDAIPDQIVGKGRVIITEAGILGVAFLALRLRRIEARVLFRWNGVPGRTVPPLIAVAVGSAVILDGLDRLVGLLIPLPGLQAARLEAALTPANGWELALLIIGLGIAAPLVEESLFRGAIQQSLEVRADVTRGVLLTALLFAVLHLQIWWFVQLLVMAVFLGYLAWVSDSIIPAIMVHAANNLLSLSVTLTSANTLEKFYLIDGQLNPFIGLAGVLMVMLGMRGARFPGRVSEPDEMSDESDRPE